MKRNVLWRRIVGCALASVMIIGTLIACGNETTKPSASSETTKPSESVAVSESTATSEVVEEKAVYPIEGDVTLTFAMVEEANTTQAGYDNIAETPFGKAWQEATGVTLDVVQLASKDAMNLLLSGGDLPDIIYIKNYEDGASGLLNEGIAVSLNDYWEYAPEYKAVLESDSRYMKAYSNSEGEVGAFGFIRGDEYLLTYKGFAVRQDWLDELKIETPTTPAEFKDMLIAFRDEKNAKAPLSIPFVSLGDLMAYNGYISYGFGLPSCGFYQEDGKVHWGITEPEYKDVLLYLRELYTEGLLDQNMMTIGQADFRAQFMNGDTGVIIDSAGGGIGGFMSTMADEPTFDVGGIAPLVAKEGDVACVSQYDQAATNYIAVITTSCKNVEAAVRFLNYGYTEEGSMLFNFGIEGESYNMVDGYPTYTETIMNNPEGLSKAIAMTSYMRSQADFPFVQRKEYMEQYSNLPQQQAALAEWAKHNAKDYVLPNMSLLADEADEYSKLYADANTYVWEFAGDYITGELPVDAFETDYVPALEKCNVNRIIKIQQNALDAYNAN